MDTSFLPAGFPLNDLKKHTDAIKANTGKLGEANGHNVRKWKAVDATISGKCANVGCQANVVISLETTQLLHAEGLEIDCTGEKRPF